MVDHNHLWENANDPSVTFFSEERSVILLVKTKLHVKFSKNRSIINSMIEDKQENTKFKLIYN